MRKDRSAFDRKASDEIQEEWNDYCPKSRERPTGWETSAFYEVASPKPLSIFETGARYLGKLSYQESRTIYRVE